ncbi:hypothetical protein L6452_00491 [Arctium lappa]|uniref:Uncharacterized protein n=1 Tax=Arctium lappa TaxID=4217 RepID=A0ACB9FDJ5_ARCLA|nr:hypothetical protein L6452_00491 [Arctium lappa]
MVCQTNLSFSNNLIHALQSYSNLLELLDVVNMNLDSLSKKQDTLADVLSMLDVIMKGKLQVGSCGSRMVMTRVGDKGDDEANSIVFKATHPPSEWINNSEPTSCFPSI